ncbi:MAG: hypothetical protein IK151_02225 [Erysipelotrichaceae bacterium]|nr:hypothetical protein [Erysipelotrichaceae bacterium]
MNKRISIGKKSELDEYFRNLLPEISKKEIISVLPYDDWEHGVLESAGFTDENNVFVNDQGFAIIFKDHSYLYLYKPSVSHIFIHYSQLDEDNIRKVESFNRKDLLNSNGYSFTYGNVVSIETDSNTESLGSVIIKMKNGNELKFDNESEEFKGYMNMTVKGLNK